MNSFSNPYSVPEDRPVPDAILQILAVVDRVALAQECPYVVVGATARDLLLFHVFGVPGSRATLDVDFGVVVESWERFQSIRDALLATEVFVTSKLKHRLLLQTMRIPIDLIPFGGLAKDEMIAWPPDGDTMMTVAGFDDAIAASIQITVCPTLTVPVVSLAALAILKVFAWQDRKTTDKDALDLYRVISTYGDAGNEDRLYDPDSPHMDRFHYDFELAGAALAGEDSRKLSGAATVSRIRTFASDEAFLETLAERVRTSRWPFEPEKLEPIRAVFVAYFDELLR